VQNPKIQDKYVCEQLVYSH